MQHILETLDFQHFDRFILTWILAVVPSAVWVISASVFFAIPECIATTPNPNRASTPEQNEERKSGEIWQPPRYFHAYQSPFPLLETMKKTFGIQLNRPILKKAGFYVAARLASGVSLSGRQRHPNSTQFHPMFNDRAVLVLRKRISGTHGRPLFLSIVRVFAECSIG